MDYLYEPNGPSGFRCGYCKSPDTSKVEGVLAHRMTCGDFQELVDRGFQRSGKFVYRPFMKETCCPQYVFRTDATKFRLSKQQRATIRKMHRYLVQGEPRTVRDEVEPCNSTPNEARMVRNVTPSEPEESSKSEAKKREGKAVHPGLGADPNKPPCKKAKLLRKEHRAKKAAEKAQNATSLKQHPVTSSQPAESTASSSSVAECMAEKMAIPHAPSYAHTLTTRFVHCSLGDKTFSDTYDESYQVFRKFQLGVHREKEEDCREENFNEFLVDTPLARETAPVGAPCDYGSYHLQYLIDGKIFAVGVLDIIPKGVLCEYLYYDPAYRFLAPGVYSALFEISLTQSFYKVNPEMQYYYMGFYVQSCPKMNYKRQYGSSELLCPETHSYVPLPLCIPRLKEKAYCRLNEDAPLVNERNEATEEVVGALSILYRMEKMVYRDYRTQFGESKQRLIESYVALVGQKVASRSLLHIPSNFF